MAGAVGTSEGPAVVFMVQSGLGIMGERRRGTGDLADGRSASSLSRPSPKALLRTSTSGPLLLAYTRSNPSSVRKCREDCL